MALISVKTILTSLAFFHITLAFFFITNPATIADQALVFVIGEAMGMPHARAFETQSPALAFLGVILAFLGISDLVTLSLPDEIGLLHHWSAQAPLRLALSMATCFYTFFASSASPYYQNPAAGGVTGSGARLAHPSAHASVPGYKPSGWGGDMLKNRVFFTFMFVEMISWFWVWVTLKEEVREVVVKAGRRRRNSQGL
ncbi:increased loss of mitochondrial DNA protein 1 [Coniochaeta sp. 2T2.1]|nr:increased loss of mitochondrial DNA protein 1 [Coniochaeta sp. 2T2.1]